MCAQCMVTAATASAAATGARAWLATSSSAWITPRRLRRLTVVLIGAAIVASSIAL